MLAGAAEGADPAEPPIGARALFSLLVLSAIVGLNTVDRNLLGLLLPQIQAEIALSDTQLGLLMGPGFVIVYSLAGVPLAWAADRSGRRTIIAIGLACWSLVTLATGMARSFAQLLAARMALGVGEASNMAPTSALIADLFPGRRRVLAMAVFSAGGPLAIMLCYPLIGWIVDHHGWRPAFGLMGLIGLGVVALTVLVVREPPREPAEARLADDPPQSFAAAARRAIASPGFWLVTTGGTMFSINYSAMLGWLPAFMQRVHGLDAGETALLLGAYKGLLGVVATICAGLAVTGLMRLDRRWLAWAPAGFCLLIAPAQVLLLLGTTPLAWHIGLAAETVLMAAVTPCLFALVLALFDARMRATGIALYLLVFNLVGQSVGPLLVGWLNDGPLAGLGDTAVRHALLAAPGAVVLAAGLLFALSFRLEAAP